MKKLYLLTILVLVSINAHAQVIWQHPFPIDTITKQVSYQGVVQVSDATARELYLRAKAWHAAAAEPATRVPMTDDEEAGLFIGKSTTMVGDKRFTYTLAIECKAGQYEYLLTQFELLTPGATTPTATPGVNFISFPKITPLLDVATAPANCTSKGQPRPAIQKLLVKANASFEQRVNDLRKTMTESSKGNSL